MKKIILCISDYYYPATKAGGGHLAIRNIAEHLSDEFEFWILTTDHDLGDFTPFPDIEYGTWHTIGQAKVRYLSAQERRLLILAQIIQQTPHDMIYLNSFFGMMTVKTVAIRKINRIPRKPLLLGVHGEFYDKAIAYKHLKKQVYFVLTSLLRMYRNMVWHATSPEESGQIQHHLRVQSASIRVAPVLPAPVGDLPTPSSKQIHELHIIYLSRISPKKNLDGALKLLAHIKHPVQFDIYGPIEDSVYWQTCQDIMKQLPEHIQVRYCGAITEGQIELFSQYHLFLFPTHGENFGYVIQESLLGGCLPLISTNTPWRRLADKKVGWDVSSEEDYLNALEQAVMMDNSTFQMWANNAQQYGLSIVNDPVRVAQNRELFR